MMTVEDHYERLFGEFGLSPQDAARWVFASGWNSALTEFMKRIDTMPLEKDTRASFAAYIVQMMYIEANKEQMQ